MSDIAALVLFSGGQDSTLCLAHALSRYDRVETVGFDYGQRHSVELACRQDILASLRAQFPEWGARLGEDHMCDLSVLGDISETSLTSEVAIETTQAGLPNTFVPGRNLLFLTLAAAIAWRRGINILVGGMCETDYSGYPDCRRETMNAQELALARGMDRPIAIKTPLMWLNKAETWAMAEEIGGQPLVDLIVEQTHTCYLGDRTQRHDWGYGCGTCPACELRAKGYETWQSERHT
ncbi:MAG: 7-cyano-7-deazaguanine synthase QueC [Alphaproteobacteria bacterium]|nr:7-cyano-7-deazaguanine synthase QueC [Alphaproteobacteria bacterium]